MFDHIGINVQDVSRSKTFYKKALQSIDFTVISEWEEVAVGFGKERPIFWIAKGDNEYPSSTSVHIAFAAESRKIVDTFYHDAIAAGGKDNGAPGLRPQYHKDYYGAFVYDLDGNNIEVVCHKPQEEV